MGRYVVVGMVVVIAAVLAGLWVYLDERNDQWKLAEVPCETLLSTSLTLQGRKIPVGRGPTCQVMRRLAEMKAIDDPDDGTPERYLGKMVIRPWDDLWLLIFTARTEQSEPTILLRHRRGNGWSVIGRFEAAPVLETLGLPGVIDLRNIASAPLLDSVDLYQ